MPDAEIYNFLVLTAEPRGKRHPVSAASVSWHLNII